MSGPDPDSAPRPPAAALLLERELQAARANGRRATRELHASMRAELAAVQRRADRAERQLARCRERLQEQRRIVRRAEDELTRLRESSTWRAGRAVLSVPRAVRDAARRARG